MPLKKFASTETDSLIKKVTAFICSDFFLVYFDFLGYELSLNRLSNVLWNPLSVCQILCTIPAQYLVNTLISHSISNNFPIVFLLPPKTDSLLSARDEWIMLTMPQSKKAASSS